MGENTLSLTLSAFLDLEAHFANSSDQNEELMLSASDFEGLLSVQ